MIKNLYFYVFLGLIALYFFYIQSNYNYVEGYRNAKVYVGESPGPRQSLIFMNDDTFGINSIYEVGTIKMPYDKNSIGYYNSYQDSYPGYYPGYYSNI